MTAMVDRINETSSHFDARVEVALTQIGDRHTALADEVQTGDAQLREFFDTLQIKNNESLEFVTNQVAQQLSASESKIANKLDAAVARLNAVAAAAVEDTNLRSHALYEKMRARAVKVAFRAPEVAPLPGPARGISTTSAITKWPTSRRAQPLRPSRSGRTTPSFS